MPSTPGTVRFPGLLDDLDSLIRATNHFETTLSASISASATTLPVPTTTGLPATGTIDVDDEVVIYTGTTPTTITGCIRGADGSTAITHATGAKVINRIAAIHHNTIAAVLIAIETKLGAGDSIAIGGTGTLDLSGSANTGPLVILPNNRVIGGWNGAHSALLNIAGFTNADELWLYAGALKLTAAGAATLAGALTASNLPAAPTPGFLATPGLYAADLTAVTALATNTSQAQYLGKAESALTTLTVIMNVTTAAATITWAEVAIFKGIPIAGGAVSLTRVGFTSVAATHNTTGRKTTVVALSNVAAGDDLWVMYGSQATTPFQVRGTLADDLQSGVVQTFAGRPSLAVTNQATVLAGAAVVPARLVAKIG